MFLIWKKMNRRCINYMQNKWPFKPLFETGVYQGLGVAWQAGVGWDLKTAVAKIFKRPFYDNVSVYQVKVRLQKFLKSAY